MKKKIKVKKVRCAKCNKFTSSIHSKLKPIVSVYLDAYKSHADLIIYKKRYHYYNCGNIFAPNYIFKKMKKLVKNSKKTF